MLQWALLAQDTALGWGQAMGCSDTSHSTTDPVPQQLCPGVERGLGLRKRSENKRISTTSTKAERLFSFEVSTLGTVAPFQVSTFTLPMRPGFQHTVSLETLCQCLQSIWPARCCFKLRMGLSQNSGFKHLQPLGKFASQLYGFALSLLHFILTQLQFLYSPAIRSCKEI